MSAEDERDLRQRLDGVVRTLTAGPAPVERAIRHGRRMRSQRRTAALAGVAATAAIAVAVPIALQGGLPQRQHTQAKHGYPVVTVNAATAQQARDGEIAWGTVAGRHWEVRLRGADGIGRGDKCVEALGATACGLAGIFRAPGPDPVELAGNGGPPDIPGYGQTLAQYGPVAANVSYLKVHLVTGRVLTLHPVGVDGKRVVAFAAPGGMISRVCAYSRQGLLATAVPFQGRDHEGTLNAWLRPGQSGLPRAEGVIGHWTADGKPWSVTVYQGPWGRCFEIEDPGHGSSCDEDMSVEKTGLTGFEGVPTRLAYGAASPAVDYVRVSLSNGTSLRAPAVKVGIQKYFAFMVPDGLRALRWTAYDSAGHVVARGRGPN